MGYLKVQCWIFAKNTGTKNTTEPHCLLLKTNQVRGGFWQPVTGSVEPGEGYFEAACREPAEETALSFDSAPLDVGYEFEYTSQYGVTRERVFALTVEKQDNPVIDPKEHQAYRWVKPVDAMKLLKYASNLEGLKRAFKAVFGKALICLVFILIPQILIPPVIWAAQDAVVIKDEVSIFVAPDGNSEILESRKSGERIRISSFHKEGWYKVKIAPQKYGWIYQTDLAVDPDIPELKAASIDLMGQTKTKIHREVKSIFLRPQLFSFCASSANMGSYHYSYPLTAGLMVDLAFRLNLETKFLIRAGLYKSGTGGNDYFTLSRSGYPLMLGLEFLTARSYRYNYTINILAGYDLAKYTVSASKPASPSSINASASTPLGWLSYTIKKKTSANSAILFDIGGFFSTKKSANVSQAGFLGEAGSPDTIKARFSGLALSFGYEFPL